eukprot:CAMPEP_0197078430 /NCGR_PEP_ID=MMETSP1384-20130603/213119_1 /TAXON_ID=29189 /ORGANISM="Ammonia sp." /LENGTH=336 /DNA_ID=CAMNT_0042517297 /DNA_START=519 /DNA_END=1525 /DNA_ORIENTATION=-
MHVAGSLGFQPNYDIIATSIVTFTRTGFLLNVSPYFSRSFWNNQHVNAKSVESEDELRKSMIRSMAYQAVGKSNGYHAYLVKHQIDAFSLISNEYANGGKAVGELNKYGQSQINYMLALCRSIELFTRSMSNLIEIFHHATFNYICISQSKFITMAKYSIPIALIGASPLIESYAIYKNCYAPFLNQALLAVLTLSVCIGFGVYTYFVILVVCMFCADFVYCVLNAVFLTFIGVAALIKMWHLCRNRGHIAMDTHDLYLSFMALLNIYSMFSQIWLPIALNFSCGLYFVIVCVAMLSVVKRRAVLEDVKEAKQSLLNKEETAGLMVSRKKKKDKQT